MSKKKHPQIKQMDADRESPPKRLRKSSSSAVEFFPPRPELWPTIYAYEDTNPQYAGLLKVGYTTVEVRSRVAQQYPTKKPGQTALLDRAGRTCDAQRRGIPRIQYLIPTIKYIG